MRDAITDGFGREWERPWECVGEGWHPLIHRLIDELFALGWDGSLFCVKEKFGGLRFYIGAGSNAIFDRIQQAEEESVRTCEKCGKPGSNKLMRGWYMTLCPACRRLAYREMKEVKDVPAETSATA